MKFGERIGKFIEKKKAESKENKVAFGVHKDFTHNNFDYWYFNGESPRRRAEIKARFGFDDPSLLDECPFFAKIGPNKDSNVPTKYIGFSYATKEQREELEAWAQRFPYAELISGLDQSGVSTGSSVITPISEPSNKPKNGAF